MSDSILRSEPWPIRTIADVAGKPQYGWTTRAHRGDGIKFLRTTDITSGRIDWSSVPACEEPPPNVDRYQLEPGDIVVSRAGSVGFSALIDAGCPAHAVFASYLMRIHPDKARVRPEFLHQYMRSSPYWKQIEDAAVGIGLANVNGSKLAAMTLPVPPLEQQDLIVELLRQVDARSEGAGEHLDRSRRAVDRFRFSVLSAAFSGALTEDWRTENSSEAISREVIASSVRESRERGIRPGELVVDVVAGGPETWRSVPLEHCVDVLDSRRRPVNAVERARRTGSIPYYGATGQVGTIDDFLFDEELVLVGEDGAPFLDKSKPIAYVISGKSWVNNHAHVLRARTGVTSNRYVKYFLDWFDFTDYVQGSTRDKLTQGAMNAIPLVLAPFCEQAEILRRVDNLLEIGRRVRDRLDAADRQLARTKQAIRAKAFRGELLGVPDGGA